MKWYLHTIARVIYGLVGIYLLATVLFIVTVGIGLSNSPLSSEDLFFLILEVAMIWAAFYAIKKGINTISKVSALAMSILTFGFFLYILSVGDQIFVFKDVAAIFESILIFILIPFNIYWFWNYYKAIKTKPGAPTQ